MRRAVEYTQSRCPSSPLPRYVGGELIRLKSRGKISLANFGEHLARAVDRKRQHMGSRKAYIERSQNGKGETA
jgi:hypothetical protein